MHLVGDLFELDFKKLENLHMKFCFSCRALPYY